MAIRAFFLSACRVPKGVSEQTDDLAERELINTRGVLAFTHPLALVLAGGLPTK